MFQRTKMIRLYNHNSNVLDAKLNLKVETYLKTPIIYRSIALSVMTSSMGATVEQNIFKKLLFGTFRSTTGID